MTGKTLKKGGGGGRLIMNAAYESNLLKKFVFNSYLFLITILFEVEYYKDNEGVPVSNFIFD